LNYGLPSSPVHVLRGSEVPVYFAFGDNDWLVTGGFRERSTWVWNLAATDSAASLPLKLSHKDMAIVRDQAVSADGRWLLTGGAIGLGMNRIGGGSPGIAVLWDLTASDPSMSFYRVPGQDSCVESVAISPNGYWIFTFDEAAVKMWPLDDIRRGVRIDRPHRVFRGADARYPMKISPDGRWLITGSNDRKVVLLWNLTELSRNSPIALRGHEDRITAVAFSSDSRTVYTGSLDGSVRIWDLDLNELIAVARRTVGRDLTQIERSNYGLEEVALPSEQ
jgi:WD40 repeat protein